ncbi:MAG: RNase adapter RapZ [Gammaproteobacteria bacterium]|nr:RNase adapter RapZ [Gammaproteobacteria bacterium]MYC25248.1 RNase adapter RapZ [Gammaproteobacteria bacterium]
MKLYVITGRSGSGKSTVLHALEDGGFKSIDNFPVPLIVQLVEDCVSRDSQANIAVSVDARSPTSDLTQLPKILNDISSEHFRPRLVFLDATSAVLVKRFDETRRRHPLERVGVDLRQAIESESKVLAHLAEVADLQIDTTELTMHDLVNVTKERLIESSNQQLSLLFRSFAYRKGVPVDADFVFDLRCLPNPHWVSELRALSGRDRSVQEFFEEHDTVEQLYQQIVDLLASWLPLFEQQNTAYLTVALGCTGGRHRSVYMAERLAETFKSTYPHVLIRHRDYGNS